MSSKYGLGVLEFVGIAKDGLRAPAQETDSIGGQNREADASVLALPMYFDRRRPPDKRNKPVC